MLQASVEAARLDGKLDQTRKADSLGPVLRAWHDAAEALDAALARATPGLLEARTPRDQIDRQRERLEALQHRSKRFDLDADLDACVQSWQALGLELPQLSGSHRDELVRLLQQRRPAVDRATALLSEARRHQGLLLDQHRAVLEATRERDRAREKYERLRLAYLAAERDFEASQRQKALQAGAQQHEMRKAPVPDLRELPQNRPGPVLVRLPEPVAGKERKLEPLAVKPLPAPPKLPVKKLETRKVPEPKKAEPGGAKKPAPQKPQLPWQRPAAALEHHVARFEAALGNAVSGRLEKTLSHLATATHRTLVDPNASELRIHLAQIDSILARLAGKTGEQLLDGAREISTVLQRMNRIAARVGGAPHVEAFRKLIDERKGQLYRLAQEAGIKPKSPPPLPRPASGDLHRQLQALRRENPGLDKLLRNASQSQLAAELAKQARTGLQALGNVKASSGLGSTSLAGGFHALGASHLGGFGAGQRSALGALSGVGGALAKALDKELERQLRRAPPQDAGKLLAGLQQAKAKSPLRDLVRQAEERQKRLAVKTTERRGPPPAQLTAAALQDVAREHPRARGMAQHFARGGALHALCETAQRGHGLPIGQAAQHYLASRGSNQMWNAVATFNTLVGQGHKPRFSFGSWLKKNVSDHVSGAISAVSSTVSDVRDAATAFAGTARDGISSFAHRAVDVGRSTVGSIPGVVARAVGGVKSVVNRGIDRAVHAVGSGARRLYQAASDTAQGAWGGIKHSAHGLAHVARSGMQAAHGAASWVQHKAGQAAGKATAAAQWTGEKVHAGLEWARKTGVVGAVGSGLRKGLSFVKKAAEYTPLGQAVKKGYGFVKSGGLGKVWNATKDVAGKAWGGLKTAYHATSKFLQSPAGQLLVTGLSLAASFIPGGLVVKAVIGAGIGAMQAMSEGKDWKSVLASAVGGAVTGAIPFLKMGPLAKMGVGALHGGITALASGGSLKDALKGAAGGTLDAFDPGAFHALKKLKGFTAAEKLLKGKNLSKVEKELLASSKLAGPLRGLEKVMENPRARRTIGALEKAGSKAVKGGIWVSGKAARAQGVLDKVVGAGERVHGVLTQVHELAPGLAEALGDNPAGHFVGHIGELAGKGDDRLQKALEYGHGASDKLSTYRGYMDKGLGYAGVKDPAKAYEKMMARKDLRAGKKGSLEQVARLKLEDHKRKHPELHLAEAAGKRTRGSPVARRRRDPESRLEQALARGKRLVAKGKQVAQGVHDGLGKVHDVVGKGIAGADKVQSGLEQAAALAKQGAGLFGEDSDLGKHLLSLADRADHLHGYLESSLGFAKEFNEKVGKTHDVLEKVPGVHKEGEARVFLEGARKEKAQKSTKKSPHDAPDAAADAHVDAHETEEQKAKRLSQAWTKIGTVSREVQKFETRNAQSQRKIAELLAQGKANEAAIELMGAGSQCDQVGRYIREAKALAKGNDKYEKELAFYEGWHKETSAKLHAAIANTKGLGGQVAISSFGFNETSHPDIYENTRAIYAVRSKVEAFGEALHDTDAAEHVKKVLAEAKKAKADLQALKAKYRKDKSAYAFLTGGGTQDKLIDDALAKLEAKPAAPKAGQKKPAEGKKHDPGKSVQQGLKAIQQYKNKALKAGKKIDSRLEKIEKGLDKGMRVGKKVDSGLEKLAGVAEQVSQMLGEDSPMGHLAHQVGEGAGKGHEKLHDALTLAQKGKGALHQGHQIFHQGLEAAQGHHARRLEKVHGKRPGHASPHGDLGHVLGEAGHAVHDAGTLWKQGKKSVHDVQETWKHGKRGWKDAGSLVDDLKAHDWKGALGEGKHLIADGKHIFRDGKKLLGDGKKLWGEGKHLYAEGKQLAGDAVHAAQEGWHFVKGLFGGVPGPEAEAQKLVQEALLWVTEFGKAVTQAVKDVEKLMQAGQTKEAADRVQAVRHLSEQTREAVTRAVRAARAGALQREAESARKHYLDIRRGFFKFVSGMHGLSGELPEEAEAKAPPRHPLAHERKRVDPVDELLSQILGGADGRIHVDRGAARGDMDAQNFQDVDPAAVDTWIGSGEGAETFSQVFGAFLPAEGAVVVHHAAGHARAGRKGRPGQHGGHAHAHQRGQGQRGHKQGGFFAGLFDHLEGFADHVAGWAQQ
ncbi:MAG TPA: hypothetical protein VFE90_19300, partial [Myxococcales bacterium]|nr:hypothetical protein [Myxococcales bacterium]